MKTGFYKMTNEDYHTEQEHVSSSRLRKILRSPAHYNLKEKKDPTSSMVLGTAFHMAVLEPELFESSVVVAPNIKKTTKEGKAAWVNFQIDNEGKTIIDSDDYESVLRMRDSAMSHPEAVKWLHGEKELSGFWEDARGIKCKCRPDCLPGGGACVDLKSTKDASQEGFMKECANYLYHFQAAFYLEGLTEITNKPHNHFVFVAVENTPPYLTNVFISRPEFIVKGRELVNTALDRLLVCQLRNNWPGYSTEALPLDLPRWAY